jgi:hypothetical protein
MILIIMFDLKSSTDIATLSEAVASLGPSTHFFDSFWLLSTDKSLSHVRNTLRARLGFAVEVSMTELTHRHADCVPRGVLDWLAAHREPETQRSVTDTTPTEPVKLLPRP